MNLFFKPWVNIESYNVGLKGKRILVVGASHYCKHKECSYFKQCTSSESKDSSPYNVLCQHCDRDLANSTIETVEYFIEGAENVSYENFSYFMIEEMKLAPDKKTLWNHFAFMNYVQYMLGSDDDNIFTAAHDIKKTDYAAFKEVVSQLTPDIIIAWGKAGDDIKRHRILNNVIEGVDPNYIFDIENDGCAYRVIHCYHPCNMYSWFSNDAENFKKQLEFLLGK